MPKQLADMGTHYKPSQWRGKRLVYRTTDPDEPKRDLIKFLVVVIIIALIAIFTFSRWANR